MLRRWRRPGPGTRRRSAALPSGTGASCRCTATGCRVVRRRRGHGAGDVPAGLARPGDVRGARRRLRAWLYGIATNACLDFLRRTSTRTTASRRPIAAGGAVVAAVSRSPAGAGGATVGAARRRRRGQGEHRAGVSRRHPVLAGQAAGGVDPVRRARLVGQGSGGAAGPDRRLGQQRPAARPGHPARAPARAAARNGNPGWIPTSSSARCWSGIVSATERGDVAGLAALLQEDVRFSMPPQPGSWSGRDTVVAPGCRAGSGRTGSGSSAA